MKLCPAESRDNAGRVSSSAGECWEGGAEGVLEGVLEGHSECI